MRTAKIAALVVVVAVIGFYIFFMTTYYVTSHPTMFCARCHFLEPYIASWQESSHAGVNCLHCHEMRGFIGKLESKSRGLNYLYQTLTRQYNIPFRAKIFEENCFSCHFGGYRQYPDAPRITNRGVNHYQLLQENRSCIECHRDSGHEVNILIKPEMFN